MTSLSPAGMLSIEAVSVVSATVETDADTPPILTSTSDGLAPRDVPVIVKVVVVDILSGSIDVTDGVHKEAYENLQVLVGVSHAAIRGLLFTKAFTFISLSPWVDDGLSQIISVKELSMIVQREFPM
jgi:hypothetical protein